MNYNKKYRPLTFDDVVGNKKETLKIRKMLEGGEYPRSSMYQGVRGCGKTTLARITAKSLMCKSPENGVACEECDTCKKINERFIAEGGRVPGVPIQEIDINSTGTKDDILALIQDMRNKPMGHKRKVYILDEIQVMSKQAQSSLLKVLEEPNEWLYIILCTTDPEDLLVPVRSRLVEFKIRRPNVKDVQERLEYICLSEEVYYSKEALQAIAKVSNRVPRESIKNLETVVNTTGSALYDDVVELLEVVQIELYIEYIDTLLQGGDVFKALDYVNRLETEHEVDYSEFLVELSGFVIDAFNIKMGVSLDTYTEEEAKTIRKVFKTMNTGDIINLLNILDESLKLKDEAPKYAITMLTLRFGFPEYFMEVTEDDLVDEVTMRVKKELNLESRISEKNYKEKKKDSDIKAEDLEKEVTESDFADIFDTGFLVE